MVNNMNDDKLMWVERYQPNNIDECILPQRIKDSLLKMGESGNIQNYAAVGLQGSGKTSSAKALCNHVDVDYLLINMSNESGVDTVRSKIVNYASTLSFSSKYKTIILDECLEENEKVRIGTVDKWKGIALKDLKHGVVYPVVSFNMETGIFENDSGSIISDKEDDVFLLIMESGREIKVNAKHPFIVLEDHSYESDDGEMIYHHKYVEKSINDGLNSSHDIILLDDDNDFGYSFDWIKSCEDIGRHRVINLTVNKNHTFITENGIVTHNCDHASKNAQASLRGVIEEHMHNCRFIITANYKNKIIDPLFSRNPLIEFTFNNAERKEMLLQFIKRAMYILEENEVAYDKKELVEFCKSNFPDFRGILNKLQMQSIGGQLSISGLGSDSSALIAGLIQALQSSNLTQCRDWVVNNTNGNDTHTIRRALYDHMKTYVIEESIPELILLINQYDYKEAHVVDKEINFVAFLVEVMSYIKFKG